MNEIGTWIAASVAVASWIATLMNEIGTWIAASAAVASWIATYVAVKSMSRNRARQEREDMQAAISQAIHTALIEFREQIMNDVDEGYQPRPCTYSKRIETLEIEHREYTHKWKHRIVNVLTGIILFIQNSHQDSPMNSVLGDAINTLRKE